MSLDRKLRYTQQLRLPGSEKIFTTGIVAVEDSGGTTPRSRGACGWHSERRRDRNPALPCRRAAKSTGSPSTPRGQAQYFLPIHLRPPTYYGTVLHSVLRNYLYLHKQRTPCQGCIMASGDRRVSDTSRSAPRACQPCKVAKVT
jgi:hypothetical protein